MSNTKRAISQIKQAIKELEEAKKFLINDQFERAEDELADSLRYIGRALRGINHNEK
jgi:hypothetical protein